MLLTKIRDKIEENLSLTIIDPKIDNFRKYKGKNQVFITVIEKACDPFSARTMALEYLHKHSRTFLFYHHKKELSVQKNCLVVDEQTNNISLIKKPTNNILRCEDLRMSKALMKVVKTNNYVNYKNDSMMRIETSKQLHEDALLTDNLNNQFVNLFTALEVLIPKSSESKSARIDQIYQTLIPFLCVNYYRKLIGSVDLSLKQWNRSKYMRILSQVTDGSDDIERLCALMVLKKYDNNGQEPKKELDLLYDELTSDGFILMRHRMYDLHNILSKPKDILSFLERHEKRIMWHIDRIYRTRNMIVHAGKSPFYISTLVENLHCYYDTLVNQLINDNIYKKYDSIELSYISTYIKYKSHKNKLQFVGRNNRIDENNFISFIFNQ